MADFSEFAAIISTNEPLARHCRLGVGGPAAYFAQPRDADELARLVGHCRQTRVPFRVLGGGSNVVASDEGFAGMVLSLAAPAFTAIETQGTRVRAGGGALLADVIAHAAMASLTGLESFVGIPGTLGGALHGNAGSKNDHIGQHVHSVEAVTAAGERVQRLRADLRFNIHSSSLEDDIICAAVVELRADNPDDINRRIKKLWLTKGAAEPLDVPRSAYVFRSPRGHAAGDLIERAGMLGAKVGAVEMFARDPRYIIAGAGSTSKDVLRLIEAVRAAVLERTGVVIEPHVELWT